MYQSKVSTFSRFQGGQFSSIQSSNAPGFVAIPCPSHPQYAITNICKSPSCIQPLCPQCITSHVQLHEETKKPAKIQNIINTRLTCIQQLAEMKFNSESQLQKCKSEVNGNIDKFMEQNQKRLNLARNKINKIIEEIFEENIKKLNIISNSFHMQKQKRSKEAKVRLAPLQDYYEKLTNYKQELQSDEYIPAMLQILNEPPKKPVLSKPNPIQNPGSVEINQKYYDQIKSIIQKTVKVTLNTNEITNISINRTNYHSSNNMKFSRLQQSRSSSGNVGLSRQNSKKRIFDDVSSVYTQIIPSPKNIPINQAIYMQKFKSIQNSQQNYFKDINTSQLVYFEPKTKNYFRANLKYGEVGFEKCSFDANFVVPDNHRTIITPENIIFLIGGDIESQSVRTIYKINGNSIESMAQMETPRSNFAICYLKFHIYVFGGLTNQIQSHKYLSLAHQPSKKHITNLCQKYNIKSNKWETIKPMSEGACRFQTSVLDDKIIKFGGFVDSGEFLNRLDIYFPDHDSWSLVNMDPKIKLNGILMGVCSISDNEILIFGGQNDKGVMSTKTYLLSSNTSKGVYQFYDSTDLYHEATFQQAYLYQGGVMAIQNGADNRKKLIMSFRNGQWRFIGC